MGLNAALLLVMFLELLLVSYVHSGMKGKTLLPGTWYELLVV